MHLCMNNTMKRCHFSNEKNCCLFHKKKLLSQMFKITTMPAIKFIYFFNKVCKLWIDSQNYKINASFFFPLKTMLAKKIYKYENVDVGDLLTKIHLFIFGFWDVSSSATDLNSILVSFCLITVVDFSLINFLIRRSWFLINELLKDFILFYLKNGKLRS